MGKRTFVVGRRTRRSTMVLMVETVTTALLRGPWTVEAVVSPN